MIPEGLMMPAGIETPSNPFPGLRPFEFGESHLYFGRDGQSDRLIRKLGAARFVAVVGTSGSGKSSLVRAGLLPDLFSGYMPSAGSHWRVALMRPSNDPLGNLAQALNAEGVFGSEIEENAQIQTTITEATLRRGSLGLVEAVRQNRRPSNESLLVVVDQFEELFRFAHVSASEQYRYEAAAFVKLLLEAARQREHNIYIVLTMRSDFLGDCAQFWDLPEAINEGQYLIPRMTRDERAQAITGPIAVCGGQITQRLVNRLLNDTGDNTDLLPILQHALMRTWKRWAEDHTEGEAVDLRHYEAIGTMTDALSLHADEAWGELADELSRQIAERVFKALTEKGEDNREVRRPTVLGELCALSSAKPAEVISVLEVFRREGRSFLMPPATVPLDEESLIDISHESLIRNWQRLKDWVDEESQSAQIYNRLAETAVLHERGQAGLWRDPDLQLALDWRERTRPTAAWAARYHPAFDSAMNFLDASVAARDAATLEEERRRRREIRRTRVAAVVFFLLFMLSLGAVVYAVTQRNQAQAALRQVEAARDRADEQAALARLSEDAAKNAEEVALEKKHEAEESKAESEKQADIARLNARKAEDSRLEAEKQKNSAEAESTKSRQLLYASDMNLALQAYAASNIKSGRDLLASHLPRAGVAPDFGWRYLWRLLHGETESFGAGDNFSLLELAPDRRTLTLSTHGGVEVWDIASRLKLRSTEPEPLQNSAPAFRVVALSPDGKYLAVAKDETVVVWDVASDREVSTLNIDSNALGFSPDGGTLAVGRDSNEGSKVELWDVAAGRKKKSFPYNSTISVLVFSRDGMSLAALAVNQSVPLWNVVSGELQYLEGEGKESLHVGSLMELVDLKREGKQSLNAIAFSPDGGLVAAVGAGGVVKLWESGATQSLKSQSKAGNDDLISVAFSPDGKRLSVGSTGSLIRIFDVPSLRERATFKGHEGSVDFMAFLSGSSTLLTHGDDGAVKQWDIASLIHEQEPVSFSARVGYVAFSRDGSVLAAGVGDGAQLLDVETRRKLEASRFEIGWGALAVAFSPDGTRLAIGGVEAPLTVWDAATYKKIATLGEPEQSVRCIAFSPDGKRLVAGDLAHNLALWDVDTQKLVKQYEADWNPHAVAFSPDGQRIAARFLLGTVKVWDKTLTSEIFTFDDKGKDSNPNDATSMAFSPDGRLLAASFEQGEVKVWNIDGRREAALLRGHKGQVNSVAFSLDGRTLASGGEDATIKLWDTSSFKELFTLAGHTSAVNSVAFSPDGRTLASGSSDRTVRLWRAATDEEVEARRRATKNRASP